MRSDRLQDAFGLIDDTYIEDAHAVRKSKTRSASVLKGLCAAACLLLFVSVLLLKPGRDRFERKSEQAPVSQQNDSTGKPDELPVQESKQAEADADAAASPAEAENSAATLLQGAEETARYTIPGDPEIEAVRFTYEGAAYEYRAAKSDEPIDLSGFADSPEEEINTADANGCRIRLYEDGAGVCIWYRNGYAFSLSGEEGQTAEKLRALYEQLIRNNMP